MAQVNSLKSKVDKEPGNVSSLAPQQKQAAKSSAELEEMLKKIVDRMENDPLADYGVWLEHKAMADNLSALNQGDMKEAQQALEANNKQQASEKLDQVSSELERMTSLSEEMSRNQKAKDVVEAGNDLKKLGEDLVNQMKADPKDVKKVNDILQQAAKILEQVAKTLQSMPKDLPEDFVNQPALKQLEVGKSMDLLSQIQQALARGDTAQAMKLAQSFLEAAQNMQSQLAKAHDSFEQSNSAEEMEKKISEEQKMLDEITQEQLKVLAETQKLEEKRLNAVLKEQEKILEELAKRQNEVVQAAEKLGLDQAVAEPVRAAVNSELPLMKNVAGELSQKRVDKTVPWLKEIISKLTSAPPDQEKLQWIIKEEQEILAKLEKQVQPPDPFTGEDKKSFSDLGEKQSGLANQTQTLKKKIQVLSRKTASLGVKLTHSLNQAGDEMTKAVQFLKDNSSQGAFHAEEEALRHLMDGQNEMEGASGSMSGMAQRQGAGGSGGGGRSFRVIQRGGGTSGTQTGAVRLPSADEYKPPKAFREELLKSLKEKYPKVYEDVIHNYYKRLSE